MHARAAVAFPLLGPYECKRTAVATAVQLDAELATALIARGFERFSWNVTLSNDLNPKFARLAAPLSRSLGTESDGLSLAQLRCFSALNRFSSHRGSARG
jgi:hypothetical protein